VSNKTLEVASQVIFRSDAVVLLNIFTKALSKQILSHWRWMFGLQLLNFKEHLIIFIRCLEVLLQWRGQWCFSRLHRVGHVVCSSWDVRCDVLVTCGSLYVVDEPCGRLMDSVSVW